MTKTDGTKKQLVASYFRRFLSFASPSQRRAIFVRHAVIRAVIRTVIRAVIMVILLGSILGLGFWAYIYQAGGLRIVLERELSFPDSQIETSIGEARLHFFAKKSLISLTLRTVTIASGDQQITVPQISFSSAPEAWLSGQLWQMAVSQVTIDLKKQGDSFTIAGSLAKTLPALVTQNKGAHGDTNTPSLEWLANRSWHLTDSTIRLRDETGALVVFEDLSVKLFYNEITGLVISGSSAVEGHSHAQISFDAISNLRSGLSEVSLRTSNLPLDRFAPFLPRSAAPLSQLGALDSKLTLLFDGSVWQIGQGQVTLRGGRLPNGLPIARLTSQFRYSKPDDYVSLEELMLDLPENQRLTLSAHLTDLSQAESRFSAKLGLTNSPIDALLAQWPKTALPDVRAYLISSFSTGDFKSITLDFAGSYHKQKRALTLSQLAFVGDVRDVALTTELPDYGTLTGRATGNVAFELMAEGQLRNAKADITLEKGSILTTRANDPVTFTSLAGAVYYQPGQLAISDLSIDFAQDGALDADLTLSFDEARRINASQLALQSKVLSLSVLTALMPEDVMPDISSFADRYLTGGRLEDTDVRMTSDNLSGTHQISAVKATGQINDVSLHYHNNQELVRALHAEFKATNDKLVIDVTPHAAKDLSAPFDLLSASVSLSPVIAPNLVSRDVVLTAEATAELASLLPFLADNASHLKEGVPFGLTGDSAPAIRQFFTQLAARDISGDIGGTIRSGVSLSAKIGDVPFTPRINRLDGHITKGAISDVYDDFDMREVELTYGYDGVRFDASGSGILAEVAGTFALSHEAGEAHLSAQIPPQDRLAEIAHIVSGQDITGALGASLVAQTSDNGTEIHTMISADMTHSAIAVPEMNWQKLPSEAGQAVGTVIIRNGRLAQIDNISIDIGDLRAFGKLSFDEAGAFHRLQGHDISWADNRIDTLTISVVARDNETQTDITSIELSASGPEIDLRHLRANAVLDNSTNAPAGPKLAFDITSEQVMIDDNTALFGQLTGQIEPSGDGEALLQGALVYEGKNVINEASITALFGASGDYLSAVGLIGGAEARLEFFEDEAGDASLIIKTQNAGRVLSGLGITDTIRSGRMILVNQFRGDGFANYDTKIQLEEFNVIEAPAAVRAFSVLGLAGLYALVEGDGTRFTTGEAHIETRGAQHNITKLNAGGGAVGVTLIGEYNSQTRQVDVSGNLVPVNQFSKIIGAVPLLGELFSGIDHAGIFATQFNVTGDIDDPQISVNAASLVPGVIRDIFSPDWLGRERDRLFGGDNQTGK